MLPEYRNGNESMFENPDDDISTGMRQLNRQKFITKQSVSNQGLVKKNDISRPDPIFP
ncbi:MAG: hypothetical protein STSR0004_22010 [Peptococcaceae bacterium]